MNNNGEVYASPFLKNIIKKVVKNLIKISKNEAQYLRDKGWGKYISLSSSTHKSKNKRYWLTEHPKVLRVLNDYRKNGAIERHSL